MDRDQDKSVEHQKKRVQKCSRRIGHCQFKTYCIASKLEAFGILLTKQGKDCEGFTELEGLGMTLTELSEELGNVSRTLDRVGVKLARTFRED